MASHGARLAGLAAAAALCAGCATIPTSGTVHLGRAVAGLSGLDDSDVRVLPPAPTDGESPAEVVHGFFVACRNSEDDHAIAREYLAPDVATRWRPDTRVVEYDESTLDIAPVAATPARAAVTVRVNEVGEIDASGGYSLRSRSLQLALHTVRVDGQWRITDPPSGVLLSTLDVARSFRAADVYYLDPAQRVLVPDRVFLQVPRRGLPTALVRALLAGPARWLAPAVRTAFPAGVTLSGNVPVNNGVADVGLSREVLRASPQARQALSAQLVWTLRQLSEVTAVRVLVDGNPLPVPGVPDNQPRDAWANYDPDASLPDAQVFYVDGTLLRTGDGAVVDGPLGRGQLPLYAPAVSPDGSRVAGLSQSSRGTTLWVGPLHGRPTARLIAVAMTPPSFDRSGGVWTVTTDTAGRQHVVLVSGGTVREVPAPGLFAGPVQQLRLSRDGARVAAVVGTGAAAGLVVGSVGASSTGLQLGGFHGVLAAYDSVRGLTWGDADHLIVLARPVTAPADARRVVVRVDADGFSTVPLARLDVDPTSVAAAPGRPVVVAGDGQVWTSELGVWRAVGRGGDPVYPD